MADTFSNIVFGADFDPAAYLKGVDEMISSVKKLQQQEESLQKSLTDTEAEIKQNEEAQRKLQKALDDGNAAKKKDAESLKALNAELTKLKEQNAALNQTLTGQKTALDSISAKNKEVEASYAKVRTVVADLQRQAGSPVKLQINEADVLNALQQVRGYFKSFSEGIDWSNVTDDLKAQMLTAKSDIEALTLFVEQANQKLAAMDPGAEGYEDLKKAVGSANEMLDAYNVLIEETGQGQDNAGKKTVSLRTRIKELRDEMTRLEDANLEHTERYRELQKEAAKLTDQYGDMQQQIRILASDTKALDFGVAALQTAATGYQTLLGAQELFGMSSEASAEAQRKMLAVMNLVQGAQQLQNLLLKEGTLRTLGADMASKAYAATQRVVATSLHVSAGAARVLSAALAATGIGALVVGLGFLISKISEWTSETDDATAAQDRLTAAIERQNKALEYEFQALDFSTNMRVEKLKQRGAKETEIFEATQQGLQEKVRIYGQKIADLQRQYDALGTNGRVKEAKLLMDQIVKLEDEQNKTIQQIMLNGEKEKTRIAEEGRKKRTAGAKVENVYLKELARLNEELAKAKASDFISEEIIRQKFQAGLEKQLLSIDEYLRKKQLTKKQADNLKALIRQITDINAEKEIEEFRKKIEAVKLGIEKVLFDLRFADREKRLANIRDEFARESATIALETNKQRQELAASRREAFRSLEEDFKNGFIDRTQYESFAAELTDLYDKLLEDITSDASRKNADLAEKIFNASLDQIETTFRNTGIAISEGNNQLITQLSEQYLRGEISYKKYQEKLTDILRAETKKRREEELKALDEQIKAIDHRMTSVTLSPEAQKAELERLRGLRERRAALQREIASGNVDEKNTAANERLQTFERYLGIVSKFVSDIGQAWQAANEAEQRSIERSIALQEKRVEAATRVAERGNATYLKLEEERQQELLIKQEAAARRQMAINAALQASQLLVAVTGAVAKIATPGVGTVDVIASIGVIIGALASGYALVKSLQDNQPSFAEGTTYARRDARKNISKLQRKGEPAGRDTIPAWLDEGEAVTDKETNKLYHPVIKAIHNREIPPEVINGVVNMYPKWNTPQLNVTRMEAAAQVKVIQDARLFNAMQENTREVKRLQKIMRQAKVNVDMDANGLSVMVQGFITQQNLNKKA